MTRRMSQTSAVRTFARSSRSAAATGSAIPSFRPNRMASSRTQGGHLPDFPIGTRAEPLPEGTRGRLSRGGAGGTDAEIGMQTTAEPFEHLFRAFQGQHGLRFRHRRRNLFEKLHRPAPRGEPRLAPNRHAPMTRRMSQTGAVRTFARSSRSAAATGSSIPSFRPNRMASSRMRAAISQIFRSAPGPNLFRKERAAA